LPPESIQGGQQHQWMTANGRQYLGGESGDYHVTPGQRAGA